MNTKGQGQVTKAVMIDEQLFSLDVKADQLRAFLEQVVAIVNGHSSAITVIQNDLVKRAPMRDIEKSFIRISDSISLKDSEFLKSVSTSLEKPLAENIGEPFEDATNKFINKESVVSTGMAWLYKRAKDQEGKINRLEQDLNDKVSKADLSKKFKKSKRKLRDETDAVDKKLTKRIADVERNLTQENQKIQKGLSDVEKKTLWKIQDCETLLHKRINSDFVESACNSVYEKVLMEMERMKEETFRGLQLDIADLKSRVTQQEETVGERIRNMRQNIKEFGDQLQNKYVNVERLDITKNALSDRLTEVQLKIQELQRRMDQAILLEKQLPIIQGLEVKSSQLEQGQELSRKLIDELRIILESYGGSSGGGGGNSGEIDPHKLCLLEAEVKRQKVDIGDHDAKLRQIDNEMKRKFDHFEQRIISQMTLMKTQNNGGTVNKDDVLLMVERDIGQPNSVLKAKIIQILQQAVNTGTNQSLEQTLKNILNDIVDLMKRTDSLSDFEKKTSRKLKSLISNDSYDLGKKLDEKVDKDELKKELQLVNEKYKTMQELLNSIKTNMIQLQGFSEHIETLLQVNSQETVNILTGNNRIIHQRCVVCGNQSKQTKNSAERQQEMGVARMYKGDLKPSYVYEPHDVYELPPSQITVVQDNQKYINTTIGQKHIVSFKDKDKLQQSKNQLSDTGQSTFYSPPTKNFRPQSAQQK